MDSIGNYRNRHSGRIFLLGNGPSLADYDLSKLSPNECISMNRSWRDMPRALYHCISGDLRVNLNPFPQHIFFLGQPDQYPNLRMKCPVILVQTRILGVHIPVPKEDIGVPARFDLRRGWPITHCGLFAVYASWWLGFREIYLLGYDGYGNHYTDPTRRQPDHAKLKREFVGNVNALLEYDSKLNVYNCNPKNAYKNLPYPIDKPKELC